MSAYQLEHDGKAYRAYFTSNGIDKQYLGPRFATPREAIEYSDLLEGTDRISPLRESRSAQDDGGFATGNPARSGTLEDGA